MAMLLDVILKAIQVLIWLIVIDAVLTWVPSVNRRHPLVVLLRRITQPVLEPFRRLLPPGKTGYIDISPMLAILVLWILQEVVLRVGVGLTRGVVP